MEGIIHESLHQRLLRRPSLVWLALLVLNGWYFTFLIVFRDPALWVDGIGTPAFALASLFGIAWLFFWVSRRERLADPSKVELRVEQTFFRQAFVLVVLAALTWVGFDQLLRLNFWGGFDEFQAWDPRYNVPWSFDFEKLNGRPMLGSAYWLGNILGNYHISGHLAFASILVLANALLLYAIVRSIFPGSYGLALAVSALSIVNPTDPLRFYPLWAASPYRLAVAYLLVAIWAHIKVIRQRRVAWIMISTMFLTASLLMYEAAYPVAFLVPIATLMWCRADRFARYASVAWLVQFGVVACRLVQFQLGVDRSYQRDQLLGNDLSLKVLGKNYLVHLEQIKEFFDLSNYWSDHFLLGVALFASSVWAIYVISKQQDEQASQRKLFWLGTAALVSILLSLLPYAILGGNERTQFFAGPAQVLWICCTAKWVVGRFANNTKRGTFQALSMAAIVGFLVANAVVESKGKQLEASSKQTYATTVAICDQISDIIGKCEQDTVVGLLPSDDLNLGADYLLAAGGEHWVGAPVFAIGKQRIQYTNVDFGEDGFVASVCGKPIGKRRYDQLVLFRVDPRGFVYYESEWPCDDRLPKSCDSYAPETCIVLNDGGFPRKLALTGTSVSLPMPVECDSKVVLGERWGTASVGESVIEHPFADGAELWINPKAQTKGLLSLELADPKELRTGEDVFLCVEYPDGRQTEKVLVSKNETIEFSVELEPYTLNQLKVR
ncbi:MAG: hypothetical protein AAF664_18800, partial [Planctomycetota bacterium]